ncbi:hypothetical protein DIPPA_23931 [Diplonema papillatum]|nr:hypothetical protein DIPPA_23931 [Diplonema papillatum]
MNVARSSLRLYCTARVGNGAPRPRPAFKQASVLARKPEPARHRQNTGPGASTAWYLAYANDPTAVVAKLVVDGVIPADVSPFCSESVLVALQDKIEAYRKRPNESFFVHRSEKREGLLKAAIDVLASHKVADLLIMWRHLAPVVKWNEAIILHFVAKLPHSHVETLARDMKAGLEAELQQAGSAAEDNLSTLKSGRAEECAPRFETVFTAAVVTAFLRAQPKIFTYPRHISAFFDIHGFLTQLPHFDTLQLPTSYYVRIMTCLAADERPVELKNLASHLFFPRSDGTSSNTDKGVAAKWHLNQWVRAPGNLAAVADAVFLTEGSPDVSGRRRNAKETRIVRQKVAQVELATTADIQEMYLAFQATEEALFATRVAKFLADNRLFNGKVALYLAAAVSQTAINQAASVAATQDDNVPAFAFPRPSSDPRNHRGGTGRDKELVQKLAYAAVVGRSPQIQGSPQQVHGADVLKYLAPKVPIDMWWAVGVALQLPQPAFKGALKTWALERELAVVAEDAVRLAVKFQQSFIVESVLSRAVIGKQVDTALGIADALLKKQIYLSDDVFKILFLAVKTCSVRDIQRFTQLYTRFPVIPRTPEIAKCALSANVVEASCLKNAAEVDQFFSLSPEPGQRLTGPSDDGDGATMFDNPLSRSLSLLSFSHPSTKALPVYAAAAALSLNYQSIQYAPAALSVLQLCAGINSVKADHELVRVLPHFSAVPLSTALSRLFFDFHDAATSSSRSSKNPNSQSATHYAEVCTKSRSHLSSSLGISPSTRMLFLLDISAADELFDGAERPSLPPLAAGVQCIIPYSTLLSIMDATEAACGYAWLHTGKPKGHERLQALAEAVNAQPEQYTVLSPLGEVLLSQAVRVPVGKRDVLAWAANVRDGFEVEEPSFLDTDRVAGYLGTNESQYTPIVSVTRLDPRELIPMSQPLVWGGVLDGLLFCLLPAAKRVPVVILDAERDFRKNHCPMRYAEKRLNSTAEHRALCRDALFSTVFKESAHVLAEAPDEMYPGLSSRRF